MLDQVVTLSKKQARMIVLILILCFVAGFLLSYGYVKYVNQKKGSRNLAIQPTTVPSTTVPSSLASLSLSGDRKIAEIGSTFSAEIQIDSESMQVEAADFVVRFDSRYLQPREIREGRFFGVLPVKTIEKDFVKISGMANLANDTIIVPKGKGTVASIIFEALEATESTAVKIDRTETVIASSGKNILDTKKITDLNIEIK